MNDQNKKSNDDLIRTDQSEKHLDRRNPTRDEVTNPEVSEPLGYVKERPGKDGTDSQDKSDRENAEE